MKGTHCWRAWRRYEIRKVTRAKALYFQYHMEMVKTSFQEICARACYSSRPPEDLHTYFVDPYPSHRPIPLHVRLNFYIADYKFQPTHRALSSNPISFSIANSLSTGRQKKVCQAMPCARKGTSETKSKTKSRKNATPYNSRSKDARSNC